MIIHLMSDVAYVLVNFGGPRSLDEIGPFLKALLTDRDVIRTRLPGFLHQWLFTRIAKKRSKSVRGEYEEMGGKSPIYDDTEALAKEISRKLSTPILTFHRYLEATHPDFIRQLASIAVKEIRVLPLFPQFTYATTGSCARFFEARLPKEVVYRMRWIRSYPDHPAFILPFVDQIRNTLDLHGLKEEETFFLFSAHGLPVSFVASGDLYLEECRLSKEAVMSQFPKAKSLLAFQSQFGKEEWIGPATGELVKNPIPWIEGKQQLIFIPISFTSDHVETLQEVGKGYLPLIRQQGIQAFRVPALGLHPQWVEGCCQLFRSSFVANNQMLVR